MGRGIALQFKNIFPANFKAYAEACRREEVQPGRMFVSTRRGKMVGAPRYIINFPTKRHWRGKSRMEDIESGLHALAHEISRTQHSLHRTSLRSVAALVDWNGPMVRSRIVSTLLQ